MISEANHYTVFLGFANEIGEGMDVKKRWEEWLDHEAKSFKVTVIQKLFMDNL